MSSLRVLVALLTVAAVVTAFGAGTGAATATAGDTVRDDYRRYALIREQLITCALDRSWRHIAASERRRCKRLRRLYVLWAAPGESYIYHVHCRTRRCPPRPVGEPDPRRRIPRDANIIRF